MKPARSIALISAAGVLAAALASGWFANQAEGRVRAEVAAARDAYLLRSLKAAAEANVSIGLTLDQMDALQSLIEREREAAEGVLSIDVFNGSGVVVYSTDRSAIGTTVASPWVPFLDRDGTWAIPGRGERVVGTRFDNDLGRAEGGIALTLRGLEATASRENPIARLQALGAPLLATLAALLIAAVAASAALAGTLSRFRRAASVMAPGATGQPPAADSLAALAASQRERWERVRKAIADRQADLRKLDDAA